jgi:UDP-N-acetylmuramyl pentapeptide phosphotransferase/UDP-N-acetylglucosamine-1-phosphate transferase
LLPLYYLADATITLGRRLARRERVWEAHRTHFYQRATKAGFSVPQVDGVVFAVNVILVALATATIKWPRVGVELAALGAGSATVAAALWVFHRGRR